MTRGVDAKTIAAMRSNARLYLTSTCTIQRSRVSRDTTGEVLDDWYTVATNVPCGIVSERQKIVSPDRGETYQTVYGFAVAHDADVQKGDRIINLAGTLTNDGPIHINGVLPARALIPVHIVLDTDYIPGSPA